MRLSWHAVLAFHKVAHVHGLVHMQPVSAAGHRCICSWCADMLGTHEDTELECVHGRCRGSSRKSMASFLPHLVIAIVTFALAGGEAVCANREIGTEY